MSFHDYTHVKSRPYLQRYIGGSPVPPGNQWSYPTGSELTMGANPNLQAFIDAYYGNAGTMPSYCQTEFNNLTGVGYTIVLGTAPAIEDNTTALNGLIEAEYYASNPTLSPTALNPTALNDMTYSFTQILEKLNDIEKSSTTQNLYNEFTALSQNQQYLVIKQVYQQDNATLSGTYNAAFTDIYNTARIQAAITAAKSTSPGVDMWSLVIAAGLVGGVILLYNFRAKL